MKKRITITIDEDLVKWLDNKVDGLEIKNRSHAIEIFISKYKERESYFKK